MHLEEPEVNSIDNVENVNKPVFTTLNARLDVHHASNYVDLVRLGQTTQLILDKIVLGIRIQFITGDCESFINLWNKFTEWPQSVSDKSMSNQSILKQIMISFELKPNFLLTSGKTMILAPCSLAVWICSA